jgi:hypothetical protein
MQNACQYNAYRNTSLNSPVLDPKAFAALFLLI